MGRRGDETGIRRERLIRARERQKLSRNYVADTLGLSRPYVYRVEEGFRRPSLDTMVRWASLLDAPLDVFRDDIPLDVSEAA